MQAYNLAHTINTQFGTTIIIKNTQNFTSINPHIHTFSQFKINSITPHPQFFPDLEAQINETKVEIQKSILPDTQQDKIAPMSKIEGGFSKGCVCCACDLSVSL